MIVSHYIDAYAPRARLLEGSKYIICELDRSVMMTMTVKDATDLRDALTRIIEEVGNDQR